MIWQGPLTDRRCRRVLAQVPAQSRWWVLEYPDLAVGLDGAEDYAAWHRRLWSTLDASARVDWCEWHRQAWMGCEGLVHPRTPLNTQEGVCPE